MGQVTLSGGTIVSPSEFWLVAFDHDTIRLSPPQRTEKHYFPLGQKAQGGFACVARRVPQQTNTALQALVPFPAQGHARLLCFHLPPSANTPTGPTATRLFGASAPAEPRNLENNLSLCHPLFITVYYARSCSISRERDVVLFRSF